MSFIFSVHSLRRGVRCMAGQFQGQYIFQKPCKLGPVKRPRQILGFQVNTSLLVNWLTALTSLYKKLLILASCVVSRYIINVSKFVFVYASWHEMGTIDLPDTIDYILDNTGEPDLNYVGHSMGTAIFYVLCSEKPEYQNKVRSMAAMAPIAYLNHVKSPIMTFLSSIADPLAVS